MSGALTRYRVMAYVTGVVLAFLTVWLVLVLLGVAQRNAVYAVAWTTHGWCYVLYLITTLDLASRVRFKVGRTLLVMLAGTIPFMSFVAEHVVTKDVRARIAAGQATPSAPRNSATGRNPG